mmetsp:Transcript_100400/g.287307  ORF Transcript_100400/g.287307 Transcript_100400/m.287307 type:complete len:231 (+) Transcript_100400:1732-2424(+)
MRGQSVHDLRRFPHPRLPKLRKALRNAWSSLALVSSSTPSTVIFLYFRLMYLTSSGAVAGMKGGGTLRCSNFSQSMSSKNAADLIVSDPRPVEPSRLEDSKWSSFVSRSVMRGEKSSLRFRWSWIGSCRLSSLLCSDLVFSFVMTKGILAMDISWSNTPKAHQSADLPYENPAKISGAMYSFVPHSVFAPRKSRSLVASMLLFASNEQPKSITRAWPAGSITMFPGLRSR